VSHLRVLPVVLASGVVAAATVGYVIGVYLPIFNTPHTPIEGVPRSPSLSSGSPRPALARRLVFVVMDGLSFELAKELPELASLRAAGAIRLLVPPFPTYTSPALVSFMTGLDPRDHGIRFNGLLIGAAELDAVTAAAESAGASVAVRSREWPPFEGLMYPSRPGAPESAEVSFGRVRFVWSMIARAAGVTKAPAPLDGRSPARELELDYFGEVDEAGHAHGGASAQYVEAAHHTGALVARLASTLDLAQDTIVIVSDHAHRDAGGHGGLEPEVQRAFFLAAGSGVRRGVELGPRPTRDVATTLTLLGGLRVPSSNLGRPMLDALDLTDAARAAAFAGPFDQASRFACRIFPSRRCAEIDALSAGLSRSDASAIPAAEALLDAIASERAAEADARAAAARRLRMAVASVLVLGAGAALWARRRSELLAATRLLPHAVHHALVYTMTLAWIGYRASLSSMKGENYTRDTFLAATAAFVASVVVAIITRPPPLASWVVLAGTAVPLALLAAWVGADPTLLSPPGAGAVLFEIAPLALSASSLAMAMRFVARWPNRW
jgi:hypothetical protein